MRGEPVPLDFQVVADLAGQPCVHTSIDCAAELRKSVIVADHKRRGFVFEHRGEGRPFGRMERTYRRLSGQFVGGGQLRAETVGRRCHAGQSCGSVTDTRDGGIVTELGLLNRFHRLERHGIESGL